MKRLMKEKGGDETEAENNIPDRRDKREHSWKASLLTWAAYPLYY